MTDMAHTGAGLAETRDGPTLPGKAPISLRDGVWPGSFPGFLRVLGLRTLVLVSVEQVHYH